MRKKTNEFNYEKMGTGFRTRVGGEAQLWSNSMSGTSRIRAQGWIGGYLSIPKLNGNPRFADDWIPP